MSRKMRNRIPPRGGLGRRPGSGGRNDGRGWHGGDHHGRHGPPRADHHGYHHWHDNRNDGHTTGTTTGTTGTTTGGFPTSVLVDDDFSDTSSGWVNDSRGMYTDGGYLLDTGNQRAVTAPSPAESIEDAIVEVEAYDVTSNPTGTNYWDRMPLPR